MSARKRIRAITRIDCEAVLTSEDAALGARYLDEERTLPKTEDRIREQVATASEARRHRSENTRVR